MLSRVEDEKSFITSGPGDLVNVASNIFLTKLKIKRNIQSKIQSCSYSRIDKDGDLLTSVLKLYKKKNINENRYLLLQFDAFFKMCFQTFVDLQNTVLVTICTFKK